MPGKHKFWAFNALNDTNSELLLYGDISDSSWYGDEVTPKQFNQDLSNCGTNDLTVRINSGGGDVFAAQAIYSSLVNYPGKVTVRIDGLCASAATIIACAGKTIIMPNNALYMIHDPKVGLFDSYGVDELTKISNFLSKTKDTISNVYLKRVNGLSKEEINELMTNETWLTAEEAKEYGFIDVIDEETDNQPVINKGMVVVNNVSCKFNPKNKVKVEKMVNEERVKDMEEKTILAKLADLLGISDADVATKEPENKVDEEAVERERLVALDNLKNGTKAVDAMVEMAKANKTITVDAVKQYIETVKDVEVKVENKNETALAEIKKLIIDQLNSGAADIKAAAGNQSTAAIDEKQKEIDAVVNYANKGGQK